MSRPFARGAVVMRAGRYSVVWLDRGTTLVLLPILQPERCYAGDILLELSDLLACGAPIAHAVIRAQPDDTPAQGHAVVGEVPGKVMCRVAQALVRVAADAAIEGRWRGDKAHQTRTSAAVNFAR